MRLLAIAICFTGLSCAARPSLQPGEAASTCGPSVSSTAFVDELRVRYERLKSYSDHGEVGVKGGAPDAFRTAMAHQQGLFIFSGATLFFNKNVAGASVESKDSVREVLFRESGRTRRVSTFIPAFLVGATFCDDCSKLVLTGCDVQPDGSTRHTLEGPKHELVFGLAKDGLVRTVIVRNREPDPFGEKTETRIEYVVEHAE
jgi:hypothetical protein